MNLNRLSKSELQLDEDLRKMGASWFVSREYCSLIDTSHKNWTLVGQAGRDSRYDSLRQGDKIYLLKKIELMPQGRLGRNEINLSGETVLEMTEELLNRYCY